MVASVSKKCAFFLNKHVEGLFCFLATCSARHLISVRFRRSSAPGNEIFPASINQNHFPMIQKLNLPSINLFPISNEEFAHPKVSNAIIQFIEILMWNWCSPVPRRRSLVTLRRCGRVHISIEFISCRCHFVSVDAFTSHHAVRSHGFKCIVVAKMHYWNFDFQFVRYHISNATTHTHTHEQCWWAHCCEQRAPNMSGTATFIRFTENTLPERVCSMNFNGFRWRWQLIMLLAPQCLQTQCMPQGTDP